MKGLMTGLLYGRYVQKVGLLAITSMALFLAGTALGASYTMGTEASLPVLSGQNYRGTIGDRPDDGAVEALNPPLFHWIYMERPWDEVAWFKGDLRTFKFQLTTNGNFSTPYWNIATSNNFYNTLPPITNANGSTWTGSNWWRILYYNANMSSVVATSAVHHFKLSNTASNWDRSMLCDSNYLWGKLSPHPHLLVNSNNATATLANMQANFTASQNWNWGALSNFAVRMTTNSYWTNEAVLTNSGYTHAYMTSVALTYAVNSNATIAARDPATMMDIYARWWLNDPYFLAHSAYEHDPPNVYALPIMYDSFYNLASASQRSNMLHTMEVIAAKYLGDDWWFTYGFDGTKFNYATAQMLPQGAGKQGFSHARVDGHAGLMMCMAGWAESAFLRECFPYFLNYVIAKKDPADMNDGRTYSDSFTFKLSMEGAADMVSIWNFPEAQLQRNPIFQEWAKIFAYWSPQHYAANGQAWGDYGYGVGWTQGYDFIDERFHYWSRVLNHGALYRQWYQERGPGVSPVGNQSDYPFMAVCGYYFPEPTQSNWTETAHIDVHRGFAIVNSKQPNDVQAFTNTVGFITGASPGVTSDHRSSGLAGGLEMWAYGARVSAHGSGQSKHPIAQYGMTFVEGYGPFHVHGYNLTNIQSRFIAWTNTDDFAYVASDTTEAYNRRGRLADSLYETVFLFYKTNQQPYLTSMKRHFLFPHKKYLVLYDEMTTSQPATFQKLFHYMEPTGTVNTNGCSFNYTATNFYNGSNITVYVVPFVNPSLMGLTNMPGRTNYYTNPWTGEKGFYFDDIADWPNGHVWVYNKTPTTNWHFGYVVYPVKWGDSAPTITRINDYAVRIQKGDNDDTITIDPANSPTSFTLNLSGSNLGSSPPGIVDPPSNLRKVP